MNVLFLVVSMSSLIFHTEGIFFFVQRVKLCETMVYSNVNNFHNKQANFKHKVSQLISIPEMAITKIFVRVKLCGVFMDALVGSIDQSCKQKWASLMWSVPTTRNGLICARKLWMDTPSIFWNIRCTVCEQVMQQFTIHNVSMQTDYTIRAAPFLIFYVYKLCTVLTRNYAPPFCWLGLATSMGGGLIIEYV